MGTAALNGPVLDGLRSSNAGLISDKRALESDVRLLQADVDTADDLVRAMSDELVGGRLSGQRVLVVLAPGADSRTAQQIATAVDDAGGAVTGRLQLQPALFDPESTQLVEDLVASVLPAGVELPGDSAVARAGAVLSAALLVAPGADPVDRDDAQAVVSAFAEVDLVGLDDAGETPAAATLAVLVAAPAPVEPLDDEGTAAIEGLLELSGQLHARSSGVVVAGPSEAAVEGGLVRELRSAGALDAMISSVDNADRAVGQVAVVLALREQADGGSGRYGGGQGASAPVPDSGTETDEPAPEGVPAPEPQG